MNFVLSGSLLPNTYSAKLTYYSPEMKSRSGIPETRSLGLLHVRRVRNTRGRLYFLGC
ncbi:MAG: hypothetical protein AB2L26_09115 [Ignavibacteria bacterium]